MRLAQWLLISLVSCCWYGCLGDARHGPDSTQAGTTDTSGPDGSVSASSGGQGNTSVDASASASLGGTSGASESASNTTTVLAGECARFPEEVCDRCQRTCESLLQDLMERDSCESFVRCVASHCECTEETCAVDFCKCPENCVSPGGSECHSMLVDWVSCLAESCPERC